jgi:hypothetical protein
MSFILLTKSALVYEPKFGGRGGVAGSPPMSGGVAGSQPTSTAVYTGAQINFGDPTPYLTYASMTRL